MELQDKVQTYCKRLYGLLGLHTENNPLYVDDALHFRNIYGFFHLQKSVRISVGCKWHTEVQETWVINTRGTYQRLKPTMIRFLLLEKTS